MSYRKRLSVLVPMAAWLLMAIAVYAQTPAQLLQEGLFKMETEGDLKGAVKIFERIIAEPAAPKAIAAKAQLYIGLCHERMGAMEARAAYQRVIDHYGDQAEAVRAARAHLARLAKMPKPAKIDHPGMVLTQVLSSTDLSEGSLSPDGNKLAYVNRNRNRTATLVLKDLVSGTERQLVKLNNAFITAPVWSPDGKKVACSSAMLPPHTANPHTTKLMIITVEGGEIQQRASDAHVCDWSADGKTFLCARPSRDATVMDFLLVPVAGGDGKRITGIDYHMLETGSKAGYLWFQQGLPKLSPDGRFFTVALRKQEHFNIYVFPVADGKEIKITDEPSDDSHPLWSPDGRSLLFRSNRAGSWDLWSIPVRAGAAVGTPFIIRTSIGDNYPVCWTRSGKLLIATTPAVYNYVYAIPVDSRTGDIEGKASQITKAPLRGGRSPVWALSADGKSLAYISAQENVNRIVVTSLETNQETEVARFPFLIYTLAWSPDGEQLAFHSARTRSEKIGIYTIALQSKEFKMILKNPVSRFGGIDWSPDGKRIAFVKGSSDIYTVETSTREVRKIFHSDHCVIRSIKWSPDGSRMAFNYYQRQDEKTGLTIVQIEGGTKEIASYPAPGYIESHSWSPDGRFIVYSLFDPTKNVNSLWVVSATGGAPKKLNTGFENSSAPRWWTDGKRIAFTATNQATQVRRQYWVMENFQPQSREP